MGLYKGLEAKLLQTVLTAALMFLVYEKLTAATFRVMGLKHSHTHWERNLCQRLWALEKCICFWDCTWVVTGPHLLFFSHLHSLKKFWMPSVGSVATTLGIAHSLLFCGLTVLRNKTETSLKHLKWNSYCFVNWQTVTVRMIPSLCWTFWFSFELSSTTLPVFTFCQQPVGPVSCYSPHTMFMSLSNVDH